MSIQNKILRTACLSPKVVGGIILVPQEFSIVPVGNHMALIRNSLVNFTAKMDVSGTVSLA